MDENRKPEKRSGMNPNASLTIRLMGSGIVLYWLFQIIVSYVKGTPDAPTLPQLIFGILLLGGGAIAVAIMALRIYKKDKAAEAEAREAAEALPEEEPEASAEDEEA